MKTEQIATLVAECLDRCRSSGYLLATLVQFLDEMRDSGHSEMDVRTVDDIMRRILVDVVSPDELPSAIAESPTGFNAADTVKVARHLP